MSNTLQNPGISITDLWERRGSKHGKRWWFRVKMRGQVVSRAFANEDRGIGVAWGKKVRADLERDDFVPRPTPLADVLKSHLQKLRGSTDTSSRRGRSVGREGRSEAHCDELERVVNLVIKAGVGDLRKADALAKAQAVVDGIDAAPITRARYAALLRSVGVTARKLYRLPGNPFQDLEVTVPDLDAPATFTIDECRLLVSDTSLHAPYGLMVALALYGGLRLRECAWLRWSDIHDGEDEGFIAIDPPTESEREAGAKLKRNKRRSAILMPELAEILGDRKPKADGYLMPETLRTWDTQQHGRAFQKHLDLLVITKGDRSFHTLRHTFAGLALAVGVDGMALQLAMGHAGSQMTKHYAQAGARLRGAVREWPRGQITLRTPAVEQKAVGL